jgi:hypothetical protein
MEFDFLRRIGFIEQRLWDSDPRVADPAMRGIRGPL